MDRLAFTLLSDGSSDKALRAILTWALRQRFGDRAFEIHWADLRNVHPMPVKLCQRILWAIHLYPCEVLFIHRDAENQKPELRYQEIRTAIEDAKGMVATLPTICVVPVRMQEAWLLFDEAAIRAASGNPNGRMPLTIPSIDTVESLPDPKSVLFSLLKTASGLKGRRLKRFRPHVNEARITERIKDFGPLRRLNAFKRLEEDIRGLRLDVLDNVH